MYNGTKNTLKKNIYTCIKALNDFKLLEKYQNELNRTHNEEKH